MPIVDAVSTIQSIGIYFGAENLEWSALVVPIAVGIFAASIWVFHRAH